MDSLLGFMHHLPDKDLKWDKKRNNGLGGYAHGKIDWEEFCKTRLVTLKEGVNGAVVNLNNDSYADGAIMNTGFGDGAYQVEIEEGDFGEFGKRVVSAKITFIEPHDHVVFDKLTYDYLQENEVKDCSEMQIDLKTPYAMYGNVEGISKEVA